MNFAYTNYTGTGNCYDVSPTSAQYSKNDYLYDRYALIADTFFVDFKFLKPSKKPWVIFLEKEQLKLLRFDQVKLDFRIAKKEIKSREKRFKEINAKNIKIREKFKFQSRKT